jgi:hypothetical protein
MPRSDSAVDASATRDTTGSIVWSGPGNQRRRDFVRPAQERETELTVT